MSFPTTARRAMLDPQQVTVAAGGESNMVKVSDLTSNRCVVTIDIKTGAKGDDGEDVTEPLVVTYRPNAYTANTELDLNAARDSTWRSEMGLKFVETLVESWDLEWEEGVGVAITQDDLAKLPTNFIGQVIKGVSDDMGGPRASSDDS